MKVMIYAFALTVIPLAAHSRAVSMEYVTTTDDGRSWTTGVTWFYSGESVRLEERTPEGTFSYTLDSEGSVLEISKRDNDGIESFSGERIGNSVRFHETDQSRDATRELRLENGRWYQPMGLSLTSYIRSGEKNLVFNIIDLEGMQPLRMRAQRLGTESISIMGRDIDAVVVEVRPVGLLSPFWSARYWFDEDSGSFLRYRGNSGPGTPVMVMELIEEVERDLS